MERETNLCVVEASEASHRIEEIKKEMYKTMDEIEIRLSKLINNEDINVQNEKDELFEKLKELMLEKVQIVDNISKKVAGKPNLEGLIGLLERKHFIEERPYCDDHRDLEPIMP